MSVMIRYCNVQIYTWHLFQHQFHNQFIKLVLTCVYAISVQKTFQYNILS